MEYWARVTTENRRYLVEFPDAPGCHTFATRKSEVHPRALEALASWLEAHLAIGTVPPERVLNRRHSTEGWMRVVLPPMLAVRVAVRRARQDLGLTQSELARRVGVTKQHISQIESPNANIRMDTLDRIAEALALDVEITLRPRRESGEFVAAAG